jgi:hypothetical protein
MMYHTQRLGQAIVEHMGADLLIQIQRRRRWKDTINATRDKMACRNERRSV